MFVHPWIKKYSENNDAKIINSDAKTILLELAKKTALQKEIYYFIAKVSKESDITDLKKFFTQLDKSNNDILSRDDIEYGFKEIGIKLTDEELKIVWGGLDFHKDGKINYSEFLAAMISSNNIENEKKLLSVFILLKKIKIKIILHMIEWAKRLRVLNIDENELKHCFKQFNEEIKFEEFKKIILGKEEKEEKFDKDLQKLDLLVQIKSI